MNKYYPNLFTPLWVRGQRIKNRYFASPIGTHTLQGPEPYPTDETIAHFAEKAAGGAAVIHFGGIQVERKRPSDGLHMKLVLECMEDDYTLRRFRKLVDTIHCYGAKASLELSNFATHPVYTEHGVTHYGVSPGRNPDGSEVFEMTEEHMFQVIENYRTAVRGAKRAGFDMIIYHSAHGGVMPATFLSPLRNHRTDQYGGSFENRIRFPMMILDAMREEAGDDLLIEMRLSGTEKTPGGWTLEESIEYAALIQDRIDLLHVSCGNLLDLSTRAVTHPSGFLPEAPNAYLAKAIKQSGRVHIPVGTVGAIYDPEIAEGILSRGEADYILTARGLLADPELVAKAACGKRDEIVPCIKCFNCLDNYKETNYFSCAVNPRVGQEWVLNTYLPESSVQKRVLIVGGGPAGMYAAVEAAKRGHDVVLCEKEEHLGGQLVFSDQVSFKYNLKNYKDYLIRTVIRHPNIEVRLNTYVDRTYLDQEKADAVIVAIGATPRLLSLETVAEVRVLLAQETYKTPELVGEKVVVIGGGQVGCETALHLAKDMGRKVTVVELASKVAGDAILTQRIPLMEHLDRYVDVRVSMRCLGVTTNGVHCVDSEGREHQFSANTVVVAVGMKPCREEAEKLLAGAPEAYLIGDCVKAKNVKHAVRTAFDAVIQI